MLRGNWQGKVLGSGSDAWKYWDERRAGKLTKTEWIGVEGGIARSHGTCMTMGTASTMTAIAEAIGLSLPGASSIPAADIGHARMSAECGRRIVDMVWDDLTPARILSRASFENAIVVAMAMGCSTNAIIHLVAMARRAGFDIGLDDFDRASRVVPVIANIRPSGDTYLMEDFFYAGGLPALMSRLEGHLKPDALTVTGRSLGENIAGAKVFDDDVIRSVATAIYAEGALAVLRGNLAPSGCVIKPSACAPELLRHTGPAIVFDDYPAMKAAVDDESLDVTAAHVLVLRNAGPQGGPGMPEWGMLPIPKKLLKQGVRDMVRISDARMSGTSYGACILHVAPESYIGGPLALVRDRRPDHRSTSRRGASISRSSDDGAGASGAPPGRRRRRATSAATAGCSRSTSARPTRAATSTSSRPRSARRSPSRASSERAPSRPRAPSRRRSVAGTGRSSRPSAWRAKRAGSRRAPARRPATASRRTACAGSRRRPAGSRPRVFITNGPCCTTGSPIGRPCSSRNSAAPRRPFTSSTSAPARSSIAAWLVDARGRRSRTASPWKK